MNMSYKVITKEMETFIRDNSKEMIPDQLARELHVSSSTVRGYMNREGIACLRLDGRFFLKCSTKIKVKEGIFNVDKYENWLV